MLEIIFVIFLYRKLAQNAEAKGRSPKWGWLGVGLWFGFEFIGGFIAGLTGVEDDLTLYIYALIGAILGATVAFIIVMNLSTNIWNYSRDTKFAHDNPRGSKLGQYSKPNFQPANTNTQNPQNLQKALVAKSGDDTLAKCPFCQGEVIIRDFYPDYTCPYCNQQFTI